MSEQKKEKNKKENREGKIRKCICKNKKERLRVL